ncbi:hypothetical protein AC481_05570 [miscellaneous Crenarchaeota group archaeon SMTZ-80]|nr:MAG: hypothetical protein AC481_05570 [miscellaneous Crenarchaeota group archaeon SMTZ-80]
MNLLFVAYDFPPVIGGQSNYYFNLLENITKANVTILAPYIQGSELIDREIKGRIYRTRWLTLNSSLWKIIRTLPLLVLVFQVVRQEKIRLIHCGQLLSIGIIGYLFKKILGIPYWVYLHGSEIRIETKLSPVEIIGRIILQNANKIVVSSKFTCKKYVKLGIRREKMIIVTPGINMDKFRAETNTDWVRKRYSVYDKKIILTVARLFEHKGVDMVIKALPEVLARVPNTIYFIVGKGPEKERLKKMVIKNNLEENVLFIGYVPAKDLPAYYEACDVFIMVSREIREKSHVEGFGIVCLEANACGKPVIGGRTGGVEEAICDGETGLLIEPYRKEDVVQALIRLLIDKKYSQRLGNNGRERVKQNFTWKERAEIIERLL